jgi:lysophospholipase L1-like esterase
MFQRYVAIGDSSTEGLNDPDGRGGFRGWPTRLAERIASSQGSLHYANLAIRGQTTRQILEGQLGPALQLGPDLVTLFSGTNDVIARRFNADAVAADVERMHTALIGQGATLLTFTLPDLTPVMPLARWLASRVRDLNAALRSVSLATGATLVDLAAHPVAGDSRLWSEDRLHANSAGHARIAEALAEALGLPGTGPGWAAPLPERPLPTTLQRIQAELRWGRRHLLPWAWRHLRGRSSGDERKPSRPGFERLTSGTG